MSGVREAMAFVSERCSCTGSPNDWLTAAELIEALDRWREDRGLEAWSERMSAMRLRDAIETWRDPDTGIRPHRHKSSAIKYLGLVWRDT